MKKKLFGLSKTAAAVRLLGIGLLCFVSCTNILTPPQQEGTGENGQTGSVRISIGNGVPGVRTLLPEAVEFAFYRLTINTVPAGTPITHNIDSGSSATIPLEPGNWTIHVDAYSDPSGDGKAAEGDSETFMVMANETTPVNVTLRALSANGEGTLSVNITGEDVGIDGWLYIYKGPDFDILLDGYPIDHSIGLTQDIPLPAGRYRVAAVIDNVDNDAYQRTFINEVAYIYSNLTTNLNRVITAADFGALTTITGTVSYRENGVDQSDYMIAVFTGPDPRSDRFLDNFYISGSDIPNANQSYDYRLYVPKPDKDITLYFFISGNDGRDFFVDSLFLSANQTTAVKDIRTEHNTITLSGTIAVTGSGNAPPDYISIRAYPENEDSTYPGMVDGDTWEITGIPSDFSGTLGLYVDFEYNGLYYNMKDASWTSGSPTNGIALNIPIVTITGSFTATENGNPLTGSGWDYISAYREERPGSGDFNIYLDGSFNCSWSGDTCTWIFGTVGINPPAEVKIVILIEDSIGGSRKTVTETVTLGIADVTIPPKVYTFNTITLSGTIGTVTVNDQTSDFGLYAYASSESGESFYYDATITGNTWTMSGIPADIGPLTIAIEMWDEQGWYSKDITVWDSGSSPEGISLGDVALTLDPISGTVTTDGTTPLSEGELYVFDVQNTVPNLSDLPIPEGSAWIENGNVSGYSGVSSGYVVVISFGESGVFYYITDGPVSLSSPLNLNLSEMIPIQEDDDGEEPGRDPPPNPPKAEENPNARKTLIPEGFKRERF
ncbi:MAG: hypothetical protein LBH57_05305 [Treponema sp.]|jgi:hypothetical protein|nr:hypothetical protein [Treponema sp.]